MENKGQSLHDRNAIYEAAIRDKHHIYLDHVNKLRDAEMAELKKQHGVEKDKLRDTLSRVLQKSKTVCVTKRQKTNKGILKLHPPPPDETKSKYDYIRRQSIKLR